MGTLGRSLVSVRESGAYEIRANPRPYFITALERDKTGDLVARNTGERQHGAGFFSQLIFQICKK